MENSESKEKVQSVKLKANDHRQLNPTEIVLHNAKILANVDNKEANRLIGEELARLKEYLLPENSEKDLRDDPARMIQAQISLVTLSTAIEYWMALLRQKHIKVYTADQMPKA